MEVTSFKCVVKAVKILFTVVQGSVEPSFLPRMLYDQRKANGESESQ